MSEEKDEKSIKEETQYLKLVEFLESTPPSRLSDISDLSEWKWVYQSNRNVINTPDIQLHCSHESCNGIRFFRCEKGEGKTLRADDFEFFYLTYKCSNCQIVTKTFSLACRVTEKGSPQGNAYKFGELPHYGPPIPAKLMNLVGPDREIFLKGRRCENQGLGIGAFIYYRRVVENQKNRILNEIIKVSKKVGVSEEKINELEQAVKETQFSKALDIAKDSMPESLLINGHSPIRLLHSALSEGVHALTDEDCLNIASSVRIVLGELSERLGAALKDEAELAAALSTLMNHKKG